MVLTWRQREAVREAVDGGLSYKAAAEMFGCSKSTVHNVVHGTHSNGARWLSSSEIYEILCSYGEPSEDVAKRVGVPTCTVERVWSLAPASAKSVWRQRRADVQDEWRKRRGG